MMELRAEERRYLEDNPDRCWSCGHLLVFHQYEYGCCDIPRCDCTCDPWTGLLVADEEGRVREYRKEGK